MEIKTKFNVGDKVWFVNYDNIAYDCPICEEEAYNVKPRGAIEGEVENIRVEYNGLGYVEYYKIICARFKSGQCAYTDRSSDRVYATKEEAEQAYANELQEYEDEMRCEKERLIEWIREHYQDD